MKIQIKILGVLALFLVSLSAQAKMRRGFTQSNLKQTASVAGIRSSYHDVNQDGVEDVVSIVSKQKFSQSGSLIQCPSSRFHEVKENSRNLPPIRVTQPVRGHSCIYTEVQVRNGVDLRPMVTLIAPYAPRMNNGQLEQWSIVDRYNFHDLDRDGFLDLVSFPLYFIFPENDLTAVSSRTGEVLFRSGGFHRVSEIELTSDGEVLMVGDLGNPSDLGSVSFLNPRTGIQTRAPLEAAGLGEVCGINQSNARGLGTFLRETSDYDLDGYSEVIMASGFGNENSPLYVFDGRSLREGTDLVIKEFQEGPFYKLNQIRSVELADITQDGIMDLIVSETSIVYALDGNGASCNQARVLQRIEPKGSSGNQKEICILPDLNGNGISELALLGFDAGSDYLRVYDLDPANYRRERVDRGMFTTEFTTSATSLDCESRRGSFMISGNRSGEFVTELYLLKLVKSNTAPP